MLSRFEQFSFAVSCIHRNIQKIERDEMVKYGLRGSFAPYLVVLSRSPGGLTAAQLCDMCERDKAAVSRIVAELLDRGLILREDAHYRARITLTEAGKQAAAFVCERAQQAVAAAGRGLSEENRRIFYQALDLIADNIQIISREGIPT